MNYSGLSEETDRERAKERKNNNEKKKRIERKEAINHRRIILEASAL